MFLGRGDRGVEFSFVESKHGLRGFLGIEIMFAAAFVCVENMRKQQPFEGSHVGIRKVIRQPNRPSSALPSRGEKPGAAAPAIMVSARARASASLSNRSRAMARDRTEAAQAPSA